MLTYEDEITETETYTEEPYDDEYYDDEYDDDYSMMDIGVLIILMAAAAGAIAFLIRVFANSFKNLNLKIGDKISLGVESHNRKKTKKEK